MSVLKQVPQSVRCKDMIGRRSGNALIIWRINTSGRFLAADYCTLSFICVRRWHMAGNYGDMGTAACEGGTGAV